MNPTLKHKLDTLAGAARQNLERSGHLVSVAFIVHPPNNVKIVPCPFRNDYEKEIVVAALRKKVAELNATMVVLIHEAWMRTLKDATSLDDWDGVQPSESPDRKEVVAILVETLDGCYIGTAPIARNLGYPTFGAVEYMPLGERSERERFQFL